MVTKRSDGPADGTRKSARVVAAAKAKAAPAPAPTKAASKPKAKATVKKAAVAAPKTTKAAAAPKKKAAAAATTTKAKAEKGKKRAREEPKTDEEAEDDDGAVAEPKAKKAKAAPKSAASKAEAANEKDDAPAGGLELGDLVPEITLKNEKDEDVNVRELAAKGLVMFVVPKANTPGCTNQACAFRDAYDGFTEEGYAVYCLSADKPSAQEKWQAAKSLQYSLLSDPPREFISAIGAGTKSKTTRSHFIFEKGTGKLIEKQVPVVATKSSQLALDFLKGLKKKEEA